MRIRDCVLALLITSGSVASAVQPGFYPLAHPQRDFIYSFGGAISGDGLVAGGESGLSSFSPRNNVGVLWSGDNYSVSTPVTPAASQQPWAYFMGLNQDGQMGTGLTNISIGPELNDVLAVPFRWSSTDGLQPLTQETGQGHDITPDGQIIVGQWDDPNSEAAVDAFRWTKAQGMQTLARLPGALAAGTVQTAYATSADGQVLVGRAVNGDATPISVAYAWTEALGSVPLELLPNATAAVPAIARSTAWGINSDGTMIVGEARDSQTGRNAALWRFDRTTGTSTIVNLGDLPGAPASNPTGLSSGSAREISDDGKVIVGIGQSAAGNEAFIWKEGEGMFSLRSYLIDRLGFTNLADWSLSAVTDLSRDGTSITGYGSVNGATQAFVAVIPRSVAGDFNGNGQLDALDLDLMSEAMNLYDGRFDLNQDSKVDISDRRLWVATLKKTFMGDANLDGQFESGDLVAVFAAGKYETGAQASWTEGDWNGDRLFESGDLIEAFQEGGYEQGARAATAAVPEPSGWMGMLLASVPWIRRARASKFAR